MFNKKTLAEQVAAFMNKNSDRESKIKNRISSLENEAAEKERIFLIQINREHGPY